MSRKPRVVMSATFAPLLSSIVLMAMVEPCRKRFASASCVPALCTPSLMPSTRRAGVVSVLPRSSAPERSSKAATSVKVPPMSAAILSLVGTDANLLDDLAEAVELGRDLVGEFLRRGAGARLVAEAGELVAHLLRLHRLHDLAVQPGDSFRRRAGGRQHAVPRHVHHGHAGLGRRRYIGQLRRALVVRIA